MIATMTLADMQLQIGAMVILIGGAFFAGWWLRGLIDVHPEREFAPLTLPRFPMVTTDGDWPRTESEEYTEHSPQIVEPATPNGMFDDDWFPDEPR